MRKPRSAALVALTLFFALFATACDESSTGNTGDPLTADETETLVFLFIQTVSVGLEIDLGEDDEFEGEFDEIVPCFGEMGAFSIEGTYSGTQDVEEEEVNLSLDYVLDFLNCYATDGDDVDLTIDGDPGVDVVIDAVQADGVIEYDFSFGGGVSFETEDEREGRCALNLDVDIVNDLSEGDIEISFAGSACGVAASELELEDLD